MTASTGSPLRRAGGLSAIVLLACALVVGVHALTRDRIEAAQRLAQRQALAIVLPPSLYDNDPLADSVRVVAPAWLGTDAPVTVRRARRGGHATAMVLEATTSSTTSTVGIAPMPSKVAVATAALPLRSSTPFTLSS